MTWVFDWDTWWARDPPDLDSERPHGRRTAGNERIELDKLDVRLLQELTANARQKNIDIIRRLGMDPREGSIQQKVSKRIQRLREVIDSYRVFINWTHFDVYNTPMLIVRADKASTERLIAKLKEGTFPFSSSIRHIPDGFVWYARLPSAHLSELVSLVWRISESYELLMIDYKCSQTYGLWAETFDEETSDWRTDRQFCLDGPLEAIGLL